MNKPFTSLPLPPKRRLVIHMHTTSELDPILCELCESSRADFADSRPLAPMCDVCAQLLCWSCFGRDGVVPGPDLNLFRICDACAGMEPEEIAAILEMRAKLARGGIA